MTNIMVVTPGEGAHCITIDGHVGAYVDNADELRGDTITWVEDGGEYPVCGISYDGVTKSFTFGYWDNAGEWNEVACIERTWTGRSL
jgi:hypothetical protein